jgi:rhodanese-related sulfurtransferase
LPKRSEIIVYCRGPFCVYADEAIAILVKNGYKAKRLEEGFPDWQAEDLPVQISLN